MQEEDEVSSTPVGTPTCQPPSTAARGLFTSQPATPPDAAATELADEQSLTAQGDNVAADAGADDNDPYEAFGADEAGASAVEHAVVDSAVVGPETVADAEGTSPAAASSQPIATADAAGGDADGWQDDEGWGDVADDVMQPAESEGSAPGPNQADSHAAEDSTGDGTAPDAAADAETAVEAPVSQAAPVSADDAAIDDEAVADGWDADEGGWDDMNESPTPGGEATTEGDDAVSLPGPAAELLAAHESASSPVDSQVCTDGTTELGFLTS